MQKLKYSGSLKPYRGDGVSAFPGDVVEVSDEKAMQLLADFPKDFKTAIALNNGVNQLEALVKAARTAKNKRKKPTANK